MLCSSLAKLRIIFQTTTTKIADVATKFWGRGCYKYIIENRAFFCAVILSVHIDKKRFAATSLFLRDCGIFYSISMNTGSPSSRWSMACISR